MIKTANCVNLKYLAALRIWTTPERQSWQKLWQGHFSLTLSFDDIENEIIQFCRHINKQTDNYSIDLQMIYIIIFKEEIEILGNFFQPCLAICTAAVTGKSGEETSQEKLRKS